MGHWSLWCPLWPGHYGHIMCPDNLVTTDCDNKHGHQRPLSRAKCQIVSQLWEEDRLLRYLLAPLKTLNCSPGVWTLSLSWCLCCDIYRPSPWHHDHLHDSGDCLACCGCDWSHGNIVTRGMRTLMVTSHQVASSDQWEGGSGSGEGTRDTCPGSPALAAAWAQVTTRPWSHWLTALN